MRQRWLTALLLVPALTIPALAQDKAKLEWKFDAGKAFFQRMTTHTVQKMKVMNSDVNQDQTQTFFFSWTPKEKKADGSWVIVQKIEGVKMTIDIGGNKIDYDSFKDTNAANPMNDFFKALVGSEFTLTLSPTYEVTDIKGRDQFIEKLVKANQHMKPLLEQILSEKALKEMADPTFAAIPGKEVAKGTSWTKESKLDMGPIGRYENTYKYTYDGKNSDAKEEADKKLDKIKVEDTLKYFPPTEPGGGSPANNPLPFKIKSADLSATNATGTILFDADKGRIAKSEMKLTLKGQLSIEIAGQTTKVDLSQDQNTDVLTADKIDDLKK